MAQCVAGANAAVQQVEAPEEWVTGASAGGVDSKAGAIAAAERPIASEEQISAAQATKDDSKAAASVAKAVTNPA